LSRQIRRGEARELGAQRGNRLAAPWTTYEHRVSFRAARRVDVPGHLIENRCKQNRAPRRVRRKARLDGRLVVLGAEAKLTVADGQ